ncbi:PREDICTED: uncharacterized protein LOC104723237 [Camelina sativa]|uniref:Uncharacterized protein LOC104723237 n=1 Tax=Camelina sativa TaxID=90675 RepID=A0ABM0UE83_CAMSA|nr:PREDICTED: uncharacterized protein LOC104723237 [Camelina sativa]
MDDLMKQSLLKIFIVSLILTLVFLTSPSSSSSPNQETRVSTTTQKKETYLNGNESPHQLVYIKKTIPFILNRRLQRDHHHHRRRYNHHYYYYEYRHSLRRRGLHHRADDYFKMMAKKSNGLNHPIRPDAFSVMLPKGFVPPSGSSPCHNQNPNSATTLFCDLSTQTQP